MGCILLKCRKDVAVHVHCNRYLGMPQELLDDFRMDTDLPPQNWGISILKPY